MSEILFQDSFLKEMLNTSATWKGKPFLIKTQNQNIHIPLSYNLKTMPEIRLLGIESRLFFSENVSLSHPDIIHNNPHFIDLSKAKDLPLTVTFNKNNPQQKFTLSSKNSPDFLNVTYDKIETGILDTNAPEFIRFQYHNGVLTLNGKTFHDQHQIESIHTQVRTNLKTQYIYKQGNYSLTCQTINRWDIMSPVEQAEMESSMNGVVQFFKEIPIMPINIQSPNILKDMPLTLDINPFFEQGEKEVEIGLVAYDISGNFRVTIGRFTQNSARLHFTKTN